jgi:hypothetical protein
MIDEWKVAGFLLVVIAWFLWLLDEVKEPKNDVRV